MGKSWIHIEVACTPELVDELAGRVAEEFQVGVELASAGFQFYLEKENLPRGWEQRLQGIWDDFRKAFDSGVAFSYSHSLFAEEDWAERWKEHFKPLRVGKHFVVCPTWEKFQRGSEDLVIRIDPGRAFGTGHHETTRLCLEWLEERAGMQRGLACGSFLDVGVGSGILAIGAALLGCRKIVGMDIDPEALEVAQENVRLNGMENSIELRVGSAADVADRFDLVMANIQAYPLIGMAKVLREHVGGSGLVVLSGILVEQRMAVQAAYEQEGLELRQTRIAGEWCLLEFGTGRDG